MIFNLSVIWFSIMTIFLKNHPIWKMNFQTAEHNVHLQPASRLIDTHLLVAHLQTPSRHPQSQQIGTARGCQQGLGLCRSRCARECLYQTTYSIQEGVQGYFFLLIFRKESLTFELFWIFIIQWNEIIWIAEYKARIKLEFYKADPHWLKFQLHFSSQIAGPNEATTLLNRLMISGTFTGK